MAETAQQLVATIVRRAILDCTSVNGNSASPQSAVGPETLFTSPAASEIKQEIIRAGQKLWQRQYVDGNGGNISARVTDEYVICTPTLCSKGDMRTEDLSLVNLENCRICGDRPQTSEILLHLEIYKAVPSARAVIHCHPPYATAHAIAGIAPRGNMIPEQEVFVGPVAVAPYETPGTMAFARTILPFVHDHNTILLTNHGIVCWADTVSHAEWYVEVVETYCKTLTVARQLGVELKEIPADKIGGLLAMKKKLGLPDPRLQAEQPEPGAQQNGAYPRHPTPVPAGEIEELVASITSQVMAFIKATP